MEPSQNATCIECDAPIREGTRFCEECGHEIHESVEPTPVNPETCPECGSPIRSTARFCDQCGGELAEPSSDQAAAEIAEPTPTPVASAVRCPKCAAPLQDDDRFCAECGVPIADSHTSPAATASVTCSNCRHANRADYTFCEGCGSPLGATDPKPVPPTPVTAESPPPAVAAPPPVAEPVTQPPTMPTPKPVPVATSAGRDPESKGRRRRKWIVGGSAAALVVAAIGVGYLLANYEDSNDGAPGGDTSAADSGIGAVHPDGSPIAAPQVHISTLVTSDSGNPVELGLYGSESLPTSGTLLPESEKASSAAVPEYLWTTHSHIETAVGRFVEDVGMPVSYTVRIVETDDAAASGRVIAIYPDPGATLLAGESIVFDVAGWLPHDPKEQPELWSYSPVQALGARAERATFNQGSSEVSERQALLGQHVSQLPQSLQEIANRLRRPLDAQIVYMPVPDVHVHDTVVEVNPTGWVQDPNAEKLVGLQIIVAQFNPGGVSYWDQPFVTYPKWGAPGADKCPGDFDCDKLTDEFEAFIAQTYMPAFELDEQEPELKEHGDPLSTVKFPFQVTPVVLVEPWQQIELSYDMDFSVHFPAFCVPGTTNKPGQQIDMLLKEDARLVQCDFSTPTYRPAVVLSVVALWEDDLVDLNDNSHMYWHRGDTELVQIVIEMKDEYGNQCFGLGSERCYNSPNTEMIGAAMYRHSKQHLYTPVVQKVGSGGGEADRLEFLFDTHLKVYVSDAKHGSFAWGDKRECESAHVEDTGAFWGTLLKIEDALLAASPLMALLGVDGIDNLDEDCEGVPAFIPPTPKWHNVGEDHYRTYTIAGQISDFAMYNYETIWDDPNVRHNEFCGGRPYYLDMPLDPTSGEAWIDTVVGDWLDLRTDCSGSVGSKWLKLDPAAVGGPPGGPVDPTIEVSAGAVPSVVGDFPAQAATAIREAGFEAAKAGEVEVTTPSDFGRVVRQDPVSGSNADLGSTVSYWVGVESASGLVTVPDLHGMTFNEAEAVLTTVGLGIQLDGHEPVDDPGLVDRVVDQHIPPGGGVEPGRTIGVWLGQIETVPVPDLGGLELSVAEDKAASVGLTLEVAGTLTVDPDDAGRVIDQDPISGTVPVGSVIRVWIGEAAAQPPPESPPPESPPPDALPPSGGQLRHDGIGDLSEHCPQSVCPGGVLPFGVPAEWTLDVLGSAYDDPDEYADWVDAWGQFGACPGDQVLGVRWGALWVLMTDGDTEYSSSPHFFGWTYDDSYYETSRLRTEFGVGLGDSVQSVAADSYRLDQDPAYGSWYMNFGPNRDDPRSVAYVTGSSGSDYVTGMRGGIGCGE